MLRGKCLYLLLIVCVVGASKVGKEKSTRENEMKISKELPLESRETEASDTPVAVRSVLECVLSADWTCVQVKTMRAIRLWFKMGTVEESNEQPEELQLESKDSESSAQNNLAQQDGGAAGTLPGHSLLEQLAEALVDGVSALFFTDNEEDRRALVLRGCRALDLAKNQLTGRKKGQHGGILGGGHHGAGELISVIMMLKASLMAIGTGFSTLIQLKSFSFTVLGLLISIARLVMQVRQTYHPPPPPVVKVFQVHQLQEHHDEISEHEALMHHQLSLHQQQHPFSLEHHHFEAAHETAHETDHQALASHDRVYVAQKPAQKPSQKPAPRTRKPAANKQSQPIHIVPSKS